jgi:hypothetical protein
MQSFGIESGLLGAGGECQSPPPFFEAVFSRGLTLSFSFLFLFPHQPKMVLYDSRCACRVVNAGY